jgi:flagellar biosynthesis/type III secretory pathway M-ring protein FliF/YscJ
MMLFNRELLYQGTDAEEAARIWSTLEKNGIKYEMKTNIGIM